MAKHISEQVGGYAYGWVAFESTQEAREAIRKTDDGNEWVETEDGRRWNIHPPRFAGVGPLWSNDLSEALGVDEKTLVAGCRWEVTEANEGCQPLSPWYEPFDPDSELGQAAREERDRDHIAAIREDEARKIDDEEPAWPDAERCGGRITSGLSGGRPSENYCDRCGKVDGGATKGRRCVARYVPDDAGEKKPSAEGRGSALGTSVAAAARAAGFDVSRFQGPYYGTSCDVCGEGMGAALCSSGGYDVYVPNSKTTGIPDGEWLTVCSERCLASRVPVRLTLADAEKARDALRASRPVAGAGAEIPESILVAEEILAAACAEARRPA